MNSSLFATLFALFTLGAPKEQDFTLLIGVTDVEGAHRLAFTFEVQIAVNQIGEWKSANASLAGRNFSVKEDTTLGNMFYRRVLASIRTGKAGNYVRTLEFKNPHFFAELEKAQAAQNTVTVKIRFFKDGAQILLKPRKKLLVSARLKRLAKDAANGDPGFLVKEVGGFTIQRKSAHTEKKVVITKLGEQFHIAIFKHGKKLLEGSSLLTIGEKSTFQRVLVNGDRQQIQRITIIRRP